MKRLLLCVLLLATLPCFSVSGPYFVRTDGNNTNNGLANTAGGAWHDISFALAHAVTTGGVVIHVKGGTYSENIACPNGLHANICVAISGPSIGVRVVLQCDDAWSVPSSTGCLLRNVPAHGGIVVSGSNVDVTGFDYGADPDSSVGLLAICGAASGSGACPNGASVHLINNHVHDLGQNIVSGKNAALGCPDFGAIDGGPQSPGLYLSDFQVVGNRIANYGLRSSDPRNGGTCYSSYGIESSNNGERIQNNIIIEVPTFAIHFSSAPCNGMITNNTIIRPGGGAILTAGSDCPPLGEMTISNNDVDNTGPYGGVNLGTLAPPPAPGLHSVQFNWTVSVPIAGVTVTGYNVYRGTVSGGPYALAGSSTGPPFTDINLPVASTFYYVATAVAAGPIESINSNQFTAIIGGGGAGCTSNSHILIAHNVFSASALQVNGGLNGCTDVSGSLTEAPLVSFVNAPVSGIAGDYHIRAGSQAINHGGVDCVSGQSNCTPALDRDGVTRSLTTPTAGAYEFAAAVAPSPPSGLTTVVH